MWSQEADGMCCSRLINLFRKVNISFVLQACSFFLLLSRNYTLLSRFQLWLLMWLWVQLYSLTDLLNFPHDCFPIFLVDVTGQHNRWFSCMGGGPGVSMGWWRSDSDRWTKCSYPNYKREKGEYPETPPHFATLCSYEGFHLCNNLMLSQLW